MWAKLYYKTNKKAKTVLCSVIKHSRKWREHSRSREKHSPAACVHPTFLSCFSHCLASLSQNKAWFCLFYLLNNLKQQGVVSQQIIFYKMYFKPAESSQSNVLNTNLKLSCILPDWRRQNSQQNYCWLLNLHSFHLLFI